MRDAVLDLYQIHRIPILPTFTGSAAKNQETVVAKHYGFLLGNVLLDYWLPYIIRM